MPWYDRLLVWHSAQDQSDWEKLIELVRTSFDVTMRPAELQVLKDTLSALDLPSPDDNAQLPEGLVRQMTLNHNYASNNSGILLVTEIIMPLVILALTLYYRRGTGKVT